MKENVKNIKYILWDIDRTLLDFDLSEVIALKKCFKDFNLGDFTDEQLEVYKEINNRYWKDLELGKISKKEVLEGRFREFFPLYGIDPELAVDFNNTYQVAVGKVVFYIKNAEKILEALEKNYIQYGATNGIVIAQRLKLAKSGLDKVFKDVFISEELGFEKPSINFFKKVFEKVGSNNLEEYIIIGDSLTSDMQGGVNAGIVTCWYNPNKKKNDKDFIVDYEIHDLKEVLDILL